MARGTGKRGGLAEEPGVGNGELSLGEAPRLRSHSWLTKASGDIPGKREGKKGSSGGGRNTKDDRERLHKGCKGVHGRSKGTGDRDGWEGTGGPHRWPVSRQRKAHSRWKVGIQRVEGRWAEGRMEEGMA